jgi:hypothetical protein
MPCDGCPSDPESPQESSPHPESQAHVGPPDKTQGPHPEPERHAIPTIVSTSLRTQSIPISGGRRLAPIPGGIFEASSQQIPRPSSSSPSIESLAKVIPNLSQAANTFDRSAEEIRQASENFKSLNLPSSPSLTLGSQGLQKPPDIFDFPGVGEFKLLRPEDLPTAPSPFGSFTNQGKEGASENQIPSQFTSQLSQFVQQLANAVKASSGPSPSPKPIPQLGGPGTQSAPIPTPIGSGQNMPPPGFGTSIPRSQWRHRAYASGAGRGGRGGGTTPPSPPPGPSGGRKRKRKPRAKKSGSSFGFRSSFANLTSITSSGGNSLGFNFAGISAFTTSISTTTSALTGLYLAAISLGSRFREFAESVNEGNRKLAFYSGSIASAFNTLNVNESLRNFGKASFQEDSIIKLTESVDLMRDDWLKFDNNFADITNKLATSAASFSGGAGQAFGIRAEDLNQLFDRFGVGGDNLNDKVRGIGFNLTDILLLPFDALIAAINRIADVVSPRNEQELRAPNQLGPAENFAVGMVLRQFGGPIINPNPRWFGAPFGAQNPLPVPGGPGARPVGP